VATPARRVQLRIGRVDVGAHGRESARHKPTARTTGSAQATGPTKPRPISSLLAQSRAVARVGPAEVGSHGPAVRGGAGRSRRRDPRAAGRGVAAAGQGGRG
jgi:hypothetical protein